MSQSEAAEFVSRIRRTFTELQVRLLAIRKQGAGKQIMPDQSYNRQSASISPSISSCPYHDGPPALCSAIAPPPPTTLCATPTL